ncbi:unnamed protein product [Tetraodon nigroviridis]|uniref:(spotted green pufferfish) hypothetical protein n=1 Tax=Tetraodon nigroviridis TaxID=99883 RepID=Q4RK09_TETNG|nr:unnamed protein product [Tetraodon nigroviridis]
MAVGQSVLPIATRHLTPGVVDADCVAVTKRILAAGSRDMDDTLINSGSRDTICFAKSRVGEVKTGKNDRRVEMKQGEGPQGVRQSRGRGWTGLGEKTLWKQQCQDLAATNRHGNLSRSVSWEREWAELTSVWTLARGQCQHTNMAHSILPYGAIAYVLQTQAQE